MVFWQASCFFFIFFRFVSSSIEFHLILKGKGVSSFNLCLALSSLASTMDRVQGCEENQGLKSFAAFEGQRRAPCLLRFISLYLGTQQVTLVWSICLSGHLQPGWRLCFALQLFGHRRVVEKVRLTCCTPAAYRERFTTLPGPAEHIQSYSVNPHHGEGLGPHQA